MDGWQPRCGFAAREFMQDLAGRLANRIQLTTDGHRRIWKQSMKPSETSIDYAMLVKIYGDDEKGEKRYSPADCIGTRTQTITGSPNESTSAPAMSSARTSRCGCTCAGSPGSRMVLKEAGEPHCGDLAALHVLQLRSDPPDASGYSCDGRWCHGSRLGSRRYR